MSKLRIRMDRSTYIQKLEQILADYMSIDDTELGEDKFTGHHNPAQAIKAIQALNEEAIGDDEHRKDCPANGFTCTCEMWRQNKNARSAELKSIIGKEI